MGGSVEGGWVGVLREGGWGCWGLLSAEVFVSSFPTRPFQIFSWVLLTCTFHPYSLSQEALQAYSRSFPRAFIATNTPLESGNKPAPFIHISHSNYSSEIAKCILASSVSAMVLLQETCYSFSFIFCPYL